MIKVFPNLEELSKAAAQMFTDLSVKAAKETGIFSVALSGGHTPTETYKLLSQKPYANKIPWEKVHVFWGDERCVPWDSPMNNAHNAFGAFLKQVPIPSDQIHRIYTMLSPVRAAGHYDRIIQDFFRDKKPGFDLIFLGLGKDGHTASLFPNDPVLEEGLRFVADSKDPEKGINRITLTPKIINQAAQITFLVSGKEKAEILAKVFNPESDEKKLPANYIQPVQGELSWFIDREAASQLKGVDYEISK